MTQQTKKILIVFRNLHLGGAERQGLLLARYLKHELQAEVVVWGLVSDPGKVTELCDEYRIPWRSVPFHPPENWYGWPAALLRFIQTLRSEAPDIVIPYTLLPNVVCALTWRFAGVKLCVWNQEDEGIDMNRQPLDLLAVKNTPCFISNSTAGRVFLIEKYAVSPERITTIRNGVCLSKPKMSRSEWRSRLGVNEDMIIATMVANISHYKDHPTLLRAWRLFLHRKRFGSGSLLVLAGRIDVPEAEIRGLIAELGLQDSVLLTGAVDDVAGLLAASDLCVYSSRSEGIPNGVVEAMAAGLPVAAIDIPGVREAVGQEGLSFLAADAETLAESINRLYENEQLRQQFGLIMRERAASEFSVEAMCRETVDFINRQLAAKSIAPLRDDRH